MLCEVNGTLGVTATRPNEADREALLGAVRGKPDEIRRFRDSLGEISEIYGFTFDCQIDSKCRGKMLYSKEDTTQSPCMK